MLEEDLPRPILDFLHSPERDATSLRLSQKYKLHADQAAAFERAYLYMLLGVNSPHDFVEDLRNAAIDSESIKGLTNDINEQVFKKLLRKEFDAADDRPAPNPVRPSAAAQMPAVQIASVQPKDSVSSKPLAPGVNIPVRGTQAPEPVFRTMQSDMNAVQHGAAPAPYPAPASLHPAQATPARMFQTASVPVTAHPAPVMDQEMIHIVPDRPVRTAAALPPAPVQVPQVAPIKEYSSDPYREPI